MNKKGPAHEDYSGMTVNERLFTAGLLEEFDMAAQRRARAILITILMRVQLSEKDAALSVDAILENPSRYGY